MKLNVKLFYYLDCCLELYLDRLVSMIHAISSQALPLKVCLIRFFSYNFLLLPHLFHVIKIHMKVFNEVIDSPVGMDLYIPYCRCINRPRAYDIF